MLESDRAFTIIQICESIFYHYLQMHLIRMTLPFSLLKASPRVVLGLKYFKSFSHNFYQKKDVDFAFAGAAFEIGHSY